jgi:hypothetical protein
MSAPEPGLLYRISQLPSPISHGRLRNLTPRNREIAAGCDVVTVQRALGHASATVTLRTYAHMWPTAEDKTRAAAAALMANAADSLRTVERL